ncbi:hypothetical protein ACFQ08_15225 [Streptosporangium algeriense]|uniref:Proteinase inhibitor I42 chagasin domain-containing protein n=1 Tax=Streptosporangium algeriense TaxID=1682748 RepID=A0ABW3DRV7_9ACTN
MVHRTRAVTAVLAVLLTGLLAGLVTGCGTGGAVYNFGTVVRGEAGRTVEVAGTPGRRFSLAVTGGAAGWRLAALPDARVASFISEERRTEDGHETRYFVFNAKYRGTATVTLLACAGCATGTDGGREQATFKITVA